MSITVKKWAYHGSTLVKGESFRGHSLGHAEHAAQIIIYGSRDLTKQVRSLLNEHQITYKPDEEQKT